MKRVMIAAVLVAGLGAMALAVPSYAGSDTSGRCDDSTDNTTGTGIGKGDPANVDHKLDGTGIGKGDANTSLPGTTPPDTSTGTDDGKKKHCD